MSAVGRFTIIMLDGLGVGEQPDAHQFGCSGLNTIQTAATRAGGIALPNLYSLGLGNLTDIPGVAQNRSARSAFGKMQEQSAGNDTFAGVWEMMGCPFRQRFSTYKQGLPPELLDAVEQALGHKVLGNQYESGAKMIQQFADEQQATGFPILYTSDDGVVQITAHESIIAPEELYRMAERILKILQSRGIARVITRPFVGANGNYKRTERRVDFPVPDMMPTYETLPDLAARHNVPFVASNHVSDLLHNKRVTKAVHIVDNDDGVGKLLMHLSQDFRGILFFGLLDCDEYGHRKDPIGYARALEALDRRIPELQGVLRDYDVLAFTSDHGTNLTSADPDHTREYVPLFVVGREVKTSVNLGIRQTYADLGQTVADVLSLGRLKYGQSFKSQILWY